MIVVGTRKKDVIRLTEADDLAYGRNGDDVIADAQFDFVSADMMFGGRGNDTLVSWGGKDALFGGTGDDAFLLYSFVEGTTIVGGAGWDTLYLGWREGEHDLGKLQVLGIEEFVFI